MQSSFMQQEDLDVIISKTTSVILGEVLLPKHVCTIPSSVSSKDFNALNFGDVQVRKVPVGITISITGFIRFLTSKKAAIPSVTLPIPVLRMD